MEKEQQISDESLSDESVDEETIPSTPSHTVHITDQTQRKKLIEQINNLRIKHKGLQIIHKDEEGDKIRMMTISELETVLLNYKLQLRKDGDQGISKTVVSNFGSLLENSFGLEGLGDDLSNDPVITDFTNEIMEDYIGIMPKLFQFFCHSCMHVGKAIQRKTKKKDSETSVSTEEKQ